MKRLEDKSTVVTGAGNGIGQAIAIALAAEGALVVANDLGTDMLGEGQDNKAASGTVNQIEAGGGTAIADNSDVATFEGAGSLIERAIEQFGQIDIVVNCAGAAIEGSIYEMQPELYEKTIALQMSQKWFMARHSVPHMAAKGWGRIINTTSHGALGVLGQPAFAAAMGGVISMTKALAVETQGTGITVNCLAPGAATRLHAKSHDDFKKWHQEGTISDDMWNSYINTPPPEYVAPIVSWLCTNEAEYVSGQVLHAAGGQISVWSSYFEERSIYKGSHTQVPPWTIDELDELVPGNLLPKQD